MTCKLTHNTLYYGTDLALLKSSIVIRMKISRQLTRQSVFMVTASSVAKYIADPAISKIRRYNFKGRNDFSLFTNFQEKTSWKCNVVVNWKRMSSRNCIIVGSLKVMKIIWFKGMQLVVSSNWYIFHNRLTHLHVLCFFL